ncbi:hypothetical protein GBA65_14875 [Rubrobacter marinus]|uniref:Peptidase M10 metallopeptidase domain-containing protein n=1 Tax=Rubrobacter marinus TaxID=2653852 RepID=A0A6G8PZI4_9ACTN|nr:hypothetical protein [Rubrobacter marinus]QIN79590.1 hypothetical protein GBA65_14875 [Rubrobacter marinus]
MAVVSVKNHEDYLRSSVSPSASWDVRGNLFLTPSNAWPNQYGLEVDADGRVDGWALTGVPEEIVGYHYNASPPGNPKKTAITQQTTSARPADQVYKQEGPILRGMRRTHTDPRKPVPPQVDKVPVTVRGFEGGDYAWAWGLSSEEGPTTVTAFSRPFRLENNQFPRLPVPETFPAGTKTWDIYLTKRVPPGGVPNEATAALQRKVPIEQLRKGGDYPLRAPWTNLGKPPTQNLSGLGSGARPVKGKDVHQRPSRLKLRAGTWTPFRQLKNDRGPALLSQAAAPITARGTRRRQVKESVPAAPAGAQALVAASVAAQDAGLAGGGDSSPTAAAAGLPDPRLIRPSGKLPENEYLGEEIDFEESRLIALMNERRRDAGAPLLLVSQVMNRAAYRKARGHGWPIARLAREEGYDGRDLGELVVETESADDAMRAIEEHLAFLSPRRRSVGVAREGGLWVVLLGEAIEDARYEASELVCEYVDGDGVVATLASDDARAAVFNQFELVASFEDGSHGLAYSYSGSYSGHVDTAARRWNAVGPVGVRKGSNPAGVQVAITDGSLESGVYGRTYSDGRIVLNSYYMGRGTANANNACCAHEFGHALGLDHASTPSVLNTPINIDGGNHETPTSHDVSELKRRWGAGTGGTGGGGLADPNAPTPGQTQTEINQQQQNKTQITRQPAPEPQAPPGGAEPPDPPAVEYEWVPGEYLDGAGSTARFPRWRAERTSTTPGGSCTSRPAGPDLLVPRLPAQGRGGKDAYFKGDTGGGFTVHGYPEEQTPKGVAIGLAEDTPPAEDLSVLEAPDPTAVPDAPVADGEETPPAGTYLITIRGQTRSGALTQESEPARDPDTGRVGVTLAAGQTFRASAVRTVNVLGNPEFSQLDGQGTPEEWIPVNMASNQPGFFKVAAGVLTLGTTSATSLAPSMPSRVISVDPSKPLTISGTIGATRIASGILRIAMAQLNESLQTVGPDIVLYDLPQLGEARFSRTFNAGGPALNPATAFVRLRPQVAFPAGGNAANAEGYFKDLKVLRCAADIRKFAVSGGIADFSPPPATPAPGDAYVAVGPAPEPEGAVIEAEPPVEVVSFEPPAGSPAGTPGEWNPGWGQNLSPGLTSAVVPVPQGVPLHGSYCWRVADTTTGTQVVAFREKVHVLNGGDLSERFLVYVDGVMPAFGRVRIASVRSGGGGAIADVLLSSNGGLYLQTFNALGEVLVDAQAAWGIVAGTLIDVEIGVSGGGTKQGTATCSVGLNGAQRTVPANLGRMDLTNRFPRLTRIGLLGESDLRARCALLFDQIVITKRGDVLDREKPAPPANYAPPPPDRPVLAGVPRRFEPDGKPTNQAAFFLPTGSAPPHRPAVIDLLEEPIAVKPGQGYTLGMFWRWVVFASGGTAPGVQAWLEGDGVEPMLAAELGSMTGTRGWHPSGRAAPDEDDYATYTVPEAEFDEAGNPEPSYSRVRYKAVLTDGFYLFQDPLHAQGVYEDFAERDANRGYGRAIEAEISSILPTHPAARGRGREADIYWSEFGVRLASDVDAVLDPNDGVEVFFSTSRDGVSFGPETQDRELVEPAAFLKIRVVLTGDGRSGPSVPSGGIHLRTWSPVAVLLRRDGSHFPGVATLDRVLWTDDSPDSEFDTVGGRVAVFELTDEVERMGGVGIRVRTERAMKEIAAATARGEALIAEIPGAGDEEDGVAYELRCGAKAEFDTLDVPPVVVDGYRILHARAEIGEAEVLEAAVLPGPRAPLAGTA